MTNKLPSATMLLNTSFLYMAATLVALCTQLANSARPQYGQFSCLLTYDTLGLESLLYDAYKLEIVQDQKHPTRTPIDGTQINSIDVSDRIQLEHLLTNHAEPGIKFPVVEERDFDPQLPFMIFVTGFQAIEKNGSWFSSWFYRSAKTFARRDALNSADSHDGQQELGSRRGYNVVYFVWNVPEIYETGTLSQIPAYYKAMSKYLDIVDGLTRTIKVVVDYVDARNDWQSDEQRTEYYKKFVFFGHSLGAHLLSDAITKLYYDSEIKVAFGRLYGLDPATPCFVADTLGIQQTKLTNITDRTILVHSNAGVTGVRGDRGDVQIVLNGGFFQPGCDWFNFGCSHSHSSLILDYIDDACQMVAYKCRSYRHFRVGACQLSSSASQTNGDDDEFFVLVNMEIQHQDKSEVFDLMGFRRTATSETEQEKFSTHIRGLVSRRPRESKVQAQMHEQIDLEDLHWPPHDMSRVSRDRMHYVNTNPNPEVSFGSRCLQHYQLKLLVYGQGESKSYPTQCSLTSFLAPEFDKISLSLVYEPMDLYLSRAKNKPSDESTNITELIMSSKMREVIQDKFYTSLVTFPGEARVFVGALIENVDLVKLSQCLTGATVTDRTINFLLDIEFMSNINPKIRQAFSSVLCGQLTPITSDINAKDALVLQLCRYTDLSNITDSINHLLGQLNKLQESWLITLVNSFLELFMIWGPF